MLWQEFGVAGELESQRVLAQRLARPRGRGTEGVALRYEFLAITCAEKLVAVRDHTAAADGELCVVHLSHLWVAEEHRRTGLAGWLRALPLQSARACLGDGCFPTAVPIILVAEMEYPAPTFPQTKVRLLAYERAGFLKLDPLAVQYFQPDFHLPEDIDAAGGSTPLPFQLVIRQVGRESMQSMSASKAEQIVQRLYCIYGEDLRPAEILDAQRARGLARVLDRVVHLLPPTV